MAVRSLLQHRLRPAARALVLWSLMLVAAFGLVSSLYQLLVVLLATSPKIVPEAALPRNTSTAIARVVFQVGVYVATLVWSLTYVLWGRRMKSQVGGLGFLLVALLASLGWFTAPLFGKAPDIRPSPTSIVLAVLCVVAAAIAGFAELPEAADRRHE